jgi:hypothetical protein
MFGDAMLVAPVVSPGSAADGMARVSVWLPEGDWYDTATGEKLSGGQILKRRYLPSEIPVFVRPGTLIPGQRPARRLDGGCYRELVITAYPGEDGTYALYEDDGRTQDYLQGESVTIHLAQRRTPRGRVVSVAPVRGGHAGFEPRRSLEIRLPVSPPPRQVTASGRKLPWVYRLQDSGWTYDGGRAETVIRIPDLDLSAGIDVEAITDPDIPPGAAEGLKGLMSRLKQLPYVGLPWHVDCQRDPRKKLPIAAAQVGNRISRRPDTFAAELDRLRQLLPELAGALRWVRRQVPDDPEVRAAVRRRLNVLQQLQTMAGT